MCLAVPGRVVEIVDEQRQTAKVDVVGVRRSVNIGLLMGDDQPAPGDYVLIHVGFALAKIDADEAAETQRILEQLGQPYLDEVQQIRATDSG